MKKYLVIFFVICFCKLGYACSCNTFGSVAYYYNKADIVFKGTLTSVINGHHSYYDFEINYLYKGKGLDSIITLYTENSTCGTGFEMGKEYTVFSKDRFVGFCDLVIPAKNERVGSAPFDLLNYSFKRNLENELEKLVNTNGQYTQVYDDYLVAKGSFENGIAIGSWKYSKLISEDTGKIVLNHKIDEVESRQIINPLDDSLILNGFRKIATQHYRYKNDTILIAYLKKQENVYEELWLKFPSNQLYIYAKLNDRFIMYKENFSVASSTAITTTSKIENGYMQEILTKRQKTVYYLDNDLNHIFEGKEGYKGNMKRKKHNLKKLSRFPHLW